MEEIEAAVGKTHAQGVAAPGVGLGGGGGAVGDLLFEAGDARNA